MRRGLTAVLGALSVTAIVAAQTPRNSAPSEIRATFDRFCVSCHNSRLKTADLVLEAVDLEAVPAHADVWEKVIRKLRSGTMPPQGSRRPDAATYDAVAGWLETTLDRAAATRPNPGRRPAVHRLNRSEYSNAVRDLLDLDNRHHYHAL